MCWLVLLEHLLAETDDRHGRRLDGPLWRRRSVVDVLLLLEAAARVEAALLLQLEQELVDAILSLRLARHINDAVQLLDAHEDSDRVNGTKDNEQLFSIPQV